VAHLAGFVLVMALLSLVLGRLERRFATPALPPAGRTRRLLATDLSWWLFGSVLGEPIKRATGILVVVLIVVPMLLALGVPLGDGALAQLLASRWGLGHVPLWAGAPLTLLLADLFGYWVHRLKHRGGILWRVHSVHHSSERLDWLAAARAHPLEEVVTVALAFVPLFLAGARIEWLAPIGPILLLHAIVLHARVPFRYGPLRFVLVSPAFHRWHHAKGARCNYAGLFSFWDLLFGTFHLPGALPAETGIAEPMPEGFLGQLAYPFRSGGSS
jgi:sterol desaturase/sphingolipid hydroxylase (fatty acid hydroxylase superfamily)